MPGPHNVVLRNSLAEKLALAAQVEHDVLCQYLFAAASLKQHIAEGGVTYVQLEMIRRWKATILMVARQEMEHLGIVANLLTAIGEAPRFDRPDFPVAKAELGLDEVSKLEPFTAETILRFVKFEMPASVTPQQHKYLSSRISGFDPGDYDAIYKLYQEIKDLIAGIWPDDLFIGPKADQFFTGSNVSVAVRGRWLPGQAPGSSPVYDIDIPAITGTASALQAIDQIIAEGEGAPQTATTCHFERFLEIDQQLATLQKGDKLFVPGRSVVSNPSATPRADATPITNTSTLQVVELFDLGYAVMMQMIMRLFAASGETAADLTTLQNVAFFPLMTTVIRPLSDMLTEMPAGPASSPLRAGPTFGFGRRLELLPHRHAAWRNIGLQLALLDDLAAKVAADKNNPASLQDRLERVSEQVSRIRLTFDDAMTISERP